MKIDILFTLLTLLQNVFLLSLSIMKENSNAIFLKFYFNQLISNFKVCTHINYANYSLIHKIIIFLFTYNCLEMIKIKIMKK